MHMHSEKPKQNDILIGFILLAVTKYRHTVVQEVKKRELERGRWRQGRGARSVCHQQTSIW